MKLLTFIKEGKLALGVQTEQGVVDVALALSIHPQEGIPTEVMAFINGGEQACSRMKHYLDSLEMTSASPYIIDDKGLKWGPCVTFPNKIIGIGLNYRKHAEETNSPYPESPILFSKFNNALAGHQWQIAIPHVTEKLDYEVELGIVIGKTTKHIPKEDAMSYVFGYCTVNDLSARDLQLKTPQWLLGKSCDGFCPIGPYLVTADEIEDPNNLKLTTFVNGQVRQQSNTSDMIFNCTELISYLSQHMTLQPGDLILTGTPEGVVMGQPEERQVYLQPGDKVTVEVEKLGALTNIFR